MSGLLGEVLNIPDAYLDERFNQAVDKRTGLHTKTILCHPVRSSKSGGAIVAVVQMINKKNDEEFGDDDVAAVETLVARLGEELSDKFIDLLKISDKLAGQAILVGSNKTKEKLSKSRSRDL